MTRVLCTLVFLCLLAPVSLARAESAETLWTEATEKMAQGQNQEARALLQTLIRDYPAAALTDDALFLAATLSQEKLSDPQQAKALYQALVRDFPDSRSALAAQRRLDTLEELMGPGEEGAAALAAYQDLLSRYPERGDTQSLAHAHKLLEQHSQWTGAYRIRLWIAESSRRLGDLEAAAPLFEQVRESDAPAPIRVQASLGAADVEILRGHFARATSLLNDLAAQSELSASEVQALEELRARTKLGAARQRLVSGSYLLLAAMLLLLLFIARRSAASWDAFWKELRRPPIEVVYMLPVALLFTGMAYTGHQEVGPAVAIISGGGVLVAWFAANAMRAARPLSRHRALLCGSAATVATVSLCYLALHRSQLLDLLNTTLAFGPE